MVEQVEGEAFWLARRALQMNSEGVSPRSCFNGRPKL